MGVSAAGKTSVTRALAARLGRAWRDADSLHPAANVEKMAAGQPLSDEDREPWLEAVGKELLDPGGDGRIVACSALRRHYRDVLRRAAPEVIFIHLTAETSLLERRAAAREGHYMPASLLPSQLATLEVLEADERGVAIDVSGTVDATVDQACDWLSR